VLLLPASSALSRQNGVPSGRDTTAQHPPARNRCIHRAYMDRMVPGAGGHRDIPIRGHGHPTTDTRGRAISTIDRSCLEKCHPAGVRGCCKPGLSPLFEDTPAPRVGAPRGVAGADSASAAGCCGDAAPASSATPEVSIGARPGRQLTRC